ncbi:MAG: hypothetical protein RJA90_731 [Bacteroidota bacterium]
MPLNNHAADELAHGHMYVSARNQGTATVTHGNHMNAMEFAYVVINYETPALDSLYLQTKSL